MSSRIFIVHPFDVLPDYPVPLFNLYHRRHNLY